MIARLAVATDQSDNDESSTSRNKRKPPKTRPRQSREHRSHKKARPDVTLQQRPTQMRIPRSLGIRRTLAPRRQREVTSNLVQRAGHKGQTQRLSPNSRDRGIQESHRQAEDCNPQVHVERTMETQNDEERQQPRRGRKKQSPGMSIFGVREPASGKTACEETSDSHARRQSCREIPLSNLQTGKGRVPAHERHIGVQNTEAMTVNIPSHQCQAYGRPLSLVSAGSRPCHTAKVHRRWTP